MLNGNFQDIWIKFKDFGKEKKNKTEIGNCLLMV